MNTERDEIRAAEEKQIAETAALFKKHEAERASQMTARKRSARKWSGGASTTLCRDTGLGKDVLIRTDRRGKCETFIIESKQGPGGTLYYEVPLRTWRRRADADIARAAERADADIARAVRAEAKRGVK